MKSLVSIILFISGLMLPSMAQQAQEPVVTADQMRVHLTKRPEMDELHWKDPARGGVLKVRIMQVDEKAVQVQKTLATGLVARSVPITDLARVTFTPTPVEQRLLGDPSAATVPALRVIWNARKAALGMNASHVGDVGIALAKGLRLTREASGFDEAGRLLEGILGKESADHRKQAVKQELQTLEMARALVVGPPEETDRVAWKITEADGNPEALILATTWLADRHFADLKRLEEDHPRWDEDDEVRPLRLRLYHLSLDFALYPSLFHGSQCEAAANGLKKAWEVYRYVQSIELARQALEDIAALYPNSHAAKETASELARLKVRAAAAHEPEVEAESKADEEDATEEGGQPQLPKMPPPPKRYNLFDD